MQWNSYTESDGTHWHKGQNQHRYKGTESALTESALTESALTQRDRISIDTKGQNQHWHKGTELALTQRDRISIDTKGQNQHWHKGTESDDGILTQRDTRHQQLVTLLPAVTNTDILRMYNKVEYVHRHYFPHSCQGAAIRQKTRSPK